MENTTGRDLLLADLEAIYIGNLNTVDADLHLPSAGEHGTAFTWETGESRFIDPEGHVHRPLYGMGNRRVVLTVTGTREGLSEKRVFEATVLQEARKTVVKSIYPVERTGEPGTILELPSVVIAVCEDGRVTTLPVSWEVEPTVPDEGEMRVFGSLKETKLRPVAVIRPAAEGMPGKAEETLRPGCRYFPISAVRLTPGSVYAERQCRMNEYLLRQDDDQMLYNFRRACGLPTRGASPMTGWDEDACKLKGHTTGHYLSGLALAYAATGDAAFREKIRYMVHSLAECQEAFAGSGKTKPGFLSAYDEEQFDLLEQYTKYPEIWAPYYTLDKIMAGLYDCHVLAGNEEALEIEAKMGDWVWQRLSRLPQEKLNRMWSMYIAGEFGGMLGTMVKLYGLTGKEEHLRAGLLFRNEKLFYPMEQGVDTLEDMHANQHIPQILGAMDLFEASGDMACWRIGSNFWEMATGHHAYCVGGVGETELFHAPDSETRFLSEKAAESCASYNLLRLTGQIFPYRMDSRLMDYYENTLLNHIMTSASHTSDGGTTYFLPLCPGGRKEYSTTENTCCHGTGMESRYRYMEHIFAEDSEAVYVNLPVPAELHAGGVHLRLEAGGDGRMSVTALGDIRKKICLRVPAWAAEVNPPLEPGENGYAVLADGLKEGECAEVCFPWKVRENTAASDPGYAWLTWGPHILAELSGDDRFRPLPAAEDRTGGDGLPFTGGERKMIPLSQVDREAYHVYFRRER